MLIHVLSHLVWCFNKNRVGIALFRLDSIYLPNKTLLRKRIEEGSSANLPENVRDRAIDQPIFFTGYPQRGRTRLAIGPEKIRFLRSEDNAKATFAWQIYRVEE